MIEFLNSVQHSANIAVGLSIASLVISIFAAAIAVVFGGRD